DPETGEYNVSYVKRFCGPGRWALVNLTYREQGFIVRKGNPKGIRDIRDLKRPDVSFVNRQKGAGTRLLLDIKLREAGISPEEVRGYSREEYTHMAVAAAVACGVADVGLGILAAASALGLDFIPIDQERYDLALPAEFMETGHWEKLYAVITSEEYRAAVERLGGYDLRDTGRVVWRS
ncbi:MAG TPA: molybdopterin biosynthesis protein, partial [Firmicutes bacterium]|nr:molybdopterin biosynthesis protein [Bacillota bacterium]